MKLVWLAALVLVPVAAASESPLQPGIWNPDESTPVTLWLHCWGFQDCPINTQVPQDVAAYAQAESLGMVTHSQTCQEVPGVGLVGQGVHTRYAYSSPSFVEYGIDEGGRPRFHPERGLGYDVELDRGVAPVYTYYVAVKAHSGSSPVDQVPLVMPDVKVTARVGESDHVSVGHQAMDAGATIAYGESDAVTLSPLVDHPQVTYEMVDGVHVYGFTFPLAYELDQIDAEESFHIRTDVYVDVPGCNDPYGDGYVTPGNVMVFSGDGRFAHLDLAIFNPLRIEYLHPQFIGEDLVIHASAMSPWGNYDIDAESISLSVPEAPEAPVEKVAVVQRVHEFEHHTDAVDVTWLWQGPLPSSGLMHAVASFSTLQGATGHAVASFEFGSQAVVGCSAAADDARCFTMQDAQTETTPGFPVGLLLAALAIALLRRDNG